MSQIDSSDGRQGAGRAGLIAQAGIGAVAVLLGQHLGVMALAPFALGAAAWWTMTKWLQPREPALLPALAVLAGHVGWMALGWAMVGLDLGFVVEIGMCAAALVWLHRRPGLGAALFITIPWTLGVIVNGLQLAELPWGGTDSKAVLMHLTLRVSALVLIWTANPGSMRKAQAGAR